MARFDVHPLKDGTGYVLDCQADILSILNTRFMVPLLPPAEALKASERLNPEFHVEGERLIMYTQFAGSVPFRMIGDPVASLSSEHGTIMNALDMLMTGY